ncbi:MAG TPA: phytanoyl-CoA dioxygenase family protein [Allosphingosinicella sp.]|nr:phytanoyl-CoA dioxygenase family protein [Allosphingosinicella sp.]
MTSAFPRIAGLEALRLRRADNARDRMAERILLDTLGLGREQTLAWLARERPGAAQFRAWILATAGPPDPEALARYHAWLAGAAMPEATARRLAAIEAAADVLGPEALGQWADQGYVVLPGAITRAEAEAAAEALWAHLGAEPGDPDSWYGKASQGIMVQLFQHPALEPARRSPRIHKAFAQLWGNADLWMKTDRTSFNPPERPGAPFPGPHLHWDVSLVTPIPFATQAILYLTDTAPDQGAFATVPGFHRRIEAWLASLPAGADPRREILAMKAMPIAARAGDLVIWHQALPHGATPNRSDRPRLAHYVNMYSPEMERREIWR